MDIRSHYESQIASLSAEVQRLEHRDRRFYRVRGLLLATLVFFLLALLVEFIPAPWGWIGAAVTFTVLVGVAGIHEHLLQRMEIAKTRVMLQQHQLARRCRDWDQVPVPSAEVPDEYRGLARDLDLFGPASLYQFVCRAHTPNGKTCLRDWFFKPATPDEVTLRADGVRALIPMQDMRDELDLHGTLLAASETGPATLVAWAESKPTYRNTRFRWLVRSLTAIMVVVPVLILLGLIPAKWALPLYVLVGVNVILNAIFVGKVHDLFNAITAGKNELVHYAAMFRMVDRLPQDDEKLVQLRSTLHRKGVDFENVLRRLQRIMRFGSGRRSSLMGVPYVFAQILFHWDFHVLDFLERWQAQYGQEIRQWFDAVGQTEALASLATVAADHPDWVFPDVIDQFETLDAAAIGHPLLSPEKCQRNDVTVGPRGTFLLVTGSNMSGKSTLLRSLGVNTVLAQAGGPVCANGMRLPPVRLATSMRVTDSLKDGVSFFLAELQRLKQIVDQARLPDEPLLLYLLDEILQGTNSGERHVAVAKVIAHLLVSPAIGAVSTHDLALADAEELEKSCQTVHFREQFSNRNGDRQMEFDYRLRSGVSPTTNAIELLRMVGLDEHA